MNVLLISRRKFLGTIGTSITAIGAGKIFGAERTKDNIRLGVMLQAASAAELCKNAKTIAAVGFDMVQLTFFFQPTAHELKSLADTLKELKLKTTAFGTYFNLFRPDDTGFMRSSIATMKLIAEHADLFDCRQFVTWSASFSPQFQGSDPNNHTPEAVAQLHRAIREIILPVLEPIGGRVAFEPFFRHVVGTLELAREVYAPFPSNRVGLVLDPPNFISPALYPKRKEEMCRLFRELGDRIHLAHFKDMKLNAAGERVCPGPGGGEMDYPLLINEIRKLNRPLPCIIEHIKPDPVELSNTKAWVETRLETVNLRKQ
ncbi:MAG: TIM barrel protein [Kiritimatiellae bacterium]|nr:TIM barrel protein [Kiritimatiellia bacterium]MDD5519225.1 TIM barrel protein [Kiritimatiellia bacterium]